MSGGDKARDLKTRVVPDETLWIGQRGQGHLDIHGAAPDENSSFDWKYGG
jgi:hypothetical protein